MELKTGFYYNPNESGIVYEILKNNDATWVQEEPDIKLLVDTWELINIKGNQLIYKTNGNLVPLEDFNTNNLISLNFKTHKMTGNMGLKLIVSEWYKTPRM